MNTRGKKVSFGGIATAVSVILLIMSSYLPTGRFAMLFAASAVVFGFAVWFDIKSAFCVYLATTLLSVLLGHGGNIAVIGAYAACTGNYSVFKVFFDTRGVRLRVPMKILLMILYFGIIWFGAKYILNLPMKYSLYILAVVFAAAFWIWDLVLGMFCRYAERYINRIIKK